MAIRYSSLADPLIDYIDKDQENTSGRASSLLTPINYNADLFANEAKFFTGNYGFDGYIGVPGLLGPGGQQAAAHHNVAWESVDPDLSPTLRALTSAASIVGSKAVYGMSLLLQDTMPLVFSYPVLPKTLDGDGSDFEITLKDGSIVSPALAGFLPNLEYNERQTIVVAGDFGNRLNPESEGARYPVSVRIVNDGTPLQMLSAKGPVFATELSIDSSNSYVQGDGPKLVAAKLNTFSPLGEGGPIGVGATSASNSGSDLYGDQAQYRLRLYTSAGFSPDGIASLQPSEFNKYFILEAKGDNGEKISLTKSNQDYTIGKYGSIKVVGIADLAPAGTIENAAYVEDHDNYYDIILEGDLSAITRLKSVRMPSSGNYQAVYNPGGPGNNPDAQAAAPGPFTMPSVDHTIAIINDLNGAMTATYVEIEGAVRTNPLSNLPVGKLLGVAVEDTISGQQIYAYEDPYGRRFYTSFEASKDVASVLPSNLLKPKPIDLIDTTGFATDSSVIISGSFSRSASHSSTLQFYEVAGPDGGVVDPVTGRTLMPDESGYNYVARSNLLTSTNSSLEIKNKEINKFQFNAEAGKIYAPLLINEVTGEQYFAFTGANSDKSAHFTALGPNGFGVEDLFGGGDKDFSDMIVRYTITV